MWQQFWPFNQICIIRPSPPPFKFHVEFCKDTSSHIGWYQIAHHETSLSLGTKKMWMVIMMMRVRLSTSSEVWLRHVGCITPPTDTKSIARTFLHTHTAMNSQLQYWTFCWSGDSSDSTEYFWFSDFIASSLSSSSPWQIMHNEAKVSKKSVWLVCSLRIPQESAGRLDLPLCTTLHFLIIMIIILVTTMTMIITFSLWWEYVIDEYDVSPAYTNNIDG